MRLFVEIAGKRTELAVDDAVTILAVNDYGKEQDLVGVSVYAGGAELDEIKGAYVGTWPDGEEWQTEFIVEPKDENWRDMFSELLSLVKKEESS